MEDAPEDLQRTEAWLQARCGKATASRMGDLLARTKTGYGASRDNYMAEIIIERLTGQPTESYISRPMQRGIDLEPMARAAYKFRCGVEIELVGFVNHPEIEMSGASPDGYVGDRGMVEFKVPNPSTHIATLLSGSVSDAYEKQMQWQMRCADRAWCDWVSFCPDMPESMSLFVKRVERNEAMLLVMENEVRKFLKEVDDRVAELRRRYPE